MKIHLLVANHTWADWNYHSKLVKSCSAESSHSAAESAWKCMFRICNTSTFLVFFLWEINRFFSILAFSADLAIACDGMKLTVLMPRTLNISSVQMLHMCMNMTLPYECYILWQQFRMCAAVRLKPCQRPISDHSSGLHLCCRSIWMDLLQNMSWQSTLTSWRKDWAIWSSLSAAPL